VGGLDDATQFGRRPDQRADLALSPCVEARDGVERKTTCEPERRPATDAGELRQRLGRAGDAVGVRNILSGFGPPPETFGLLLMCLH